MNKQFHNRLCLADSYCARFMFWRAWASDLSCDKLKRRKNEADNSIIYISNRQNRTHNSIRILRPKKCSETIIMSRRLQNTNRFFFSVNIRPPFWQFNQINVWSDIIFFFRHLQWRTATNTRWSINVLYLWNILNQCMCRPVSVSVHIFEKKKAKEKKKRKTKLPSTGWSGTHDDII